MTQTSSKTCPACFKDIDSRASRCPSCAQRQSDVVGLYRDLPGKAVGGVCTAIALHFNWDVTLMRIAFITSLAFTGPLALWVYGAAWLMAPFEQTGKAPLARLMDWLSRLFAPQTGVARVD